MTWSKPEQLIIKGLVRSTESIETALVGNIETKEPGLIDDIRALKTSADSTEVALKKNKKQHLVIFSLIGAGIFVTLYSALGGGVINLFEFLAGLVGKIL